MTQHVYFIIIADNSSYIPKAAITHWNYSWRKFVSLCSMDWIFIRRLTFGRVSLFNWPRLLVASLSPIRPRVKSLVILCGIWEGLIGTGMGYLPEFFCFYLSVQFHIRYLIIVIVMILLSGGQAAETSEKSMPFRKRKKFRSWKFNMNMCKGLKRRVNFLLSAEHIVV